MLNLHFPSAQKINSFLIAGLIITACSSPNKEEIKQEQPAQTCLKDARANFKTKLIVQNKTTEEIPAPPADKYMLVEYQSPIGPMKAFISVFPEERKLRPAIVWVHGGFGNDLGDFWSPADPEDDQTADVFRQAGVVILHVSQRGGNNNPGFDESGFGEVDDIIAAGKFLSQQKGIDPDRIYLGGHSTGGTKALLAAEMTDVFRNTFSFGPVHSYPDYGDEFITFDKSNSKEVELREPYRWLHCLSKPVHVFEGEDGNFWALYFMDSIATSKQNKFFHVHGFSNATHFNILQPISKLIAKKILIDTVLTKEIEFTEEEKNGAFQ